ncbi:MAG: hypothetical protein C0473_02765 [Cyanobacteria bacterium DS3.002]|nr:hypothetical protein [Cyanobacteria bacterium DS3.002]MBA4049738.1 hypothetical protein [Cyanobacteria bacterium DS2.008]MBA4073409.1 hypothetical protein [Cyanobacteria bacterium PR.023]
MKKKMEYVEATLSSNAFKVLLKIAELRNVSPEAVANEILTRNLRTQKKLLKAFELPPQKA